MRAFAGLLERLVFSPGRNAKLRLIAQYFRTTPDPDRGWALAALTGELALVGAKRSLIQALVLDRVDPVLFDLSRDYVGDTAETVALIWPEGGGGAPPRLAEVVAALKVAGKTELPGLVSGWLDRLDAPARFALVKLITGALRVGVSARLAKQAVADFAGRDVGEIEELWHGLAPPYPDLFAWAEGRGSAPDVSGALRFYPLMLANPLQDGDLARLAPKDHLAEWKWDGIRVQIVARGVQGRLFSRTGDDITASFPDIARHFAYDAVLDGELLILRDGEVAPFNDLQQRLGRKTVSARIEQAHPAHVRVYDALVLAGEDLRALPLEQRRARLEDWQARVRPAAIDLSPLIRFSDWGELAALRAGARAASIEGLMLKRRDAPYLAGRPKGPWFKWKRDPLTIDAVLMYAQRGSGKRSSYYSDYTFGAWRDGAGGRELVPVGKAYFGFTDLELLELDRFVRDHTVGRFGPVREVVPKLVFEVAFDAVQRSTRHKSGVAMRFPRIHRIRWDKPAEEADWLATLEAMIEG